MVSFNNKPATDAVPLFAPVVAPGLQSLSPVISGIVDSPLRAPSRAVEAQLRATAPPVVRELLPVLDQLEPVFLEVANGAKEFVPAPEDTKNLIHPVLRRQTQPAASLPRRLHRRDVSARGDAHGLVRHRRDVGSVCAFALGGSRAAAGAGGAGRPRRSPSLWRRPEMRSAASRI